MKHIEVVSDMAGDLFHIGHINLLKNAKMYFGRQAKITVALHTDEQILSYKNILPVMNFECRKGVISACRYVDNVITAPDDFDEIFLRKFDFIVHGDDIAGWPQVLIDRFYKIALKQNKLVLLPYTKGISSTQLRNSIKAIHI